MKRLEINNSWANEPNFKNKGQAGSDREREREKRDIKRETSSQTGR